MVAFVKMSSITLIFHRAIMQEARINMIENQLRAGGVHAQEVFDAVSAVRREEFVPVPYRHYAFSDMEIPLPYAQNMFTPLCEALVLQAAAPCKNDTVLEIGTGSGYMAALLAHHSRHVTTVEIEEGLKQQAENNLNRYGIKNVHVIHDNGFSIDLYARDRLFDVIVFSGSVSSIPETFKDKLADNGKMIVFYGSHPCVQAIFLQKNSAMELKTGILFETSVKPLKEQPGRLPFRF